MNNRYDVIVVGAGAAGLMAAATAGKRGRRVLLLEATDKIAEKIRISGGGRCNFTNINAGADNYLSNNPHFMKSAFARYDQHDFISLVESYAISYHEKTLGQLFCDSSSSQIINMLVNECNKYGVEILLNATISMIKKDGLFFMESSIGKFSSESLIIASGGLSIPKMGATNFGYRIAKQFGLNIIPTKPALVPLTVSSENLEFFRSLSGISIASNVSYSDSSFKENILFTHRGLSGPAILQISSYLKEHMPQQIYMDLSPDTDLRQLFIQNKDSKTILSNFLKDYFPKRFIDSWCDPTMANNKLTDCKLKDLEYIAAQLHQFTVKIDGTEGYAKAEVTVGGVDTNELSSKTMASLKTPNLYFIGEVVDVTGWLGGYNFQWAWSSGHVAGSYA